MGNQVDNKFIWVIKNFCSEQSPKIYSDEFVVDGCKWRLLVFPKGNNVNQLSLYLEVVGSELLPAGWRRNAKFHLTILNPLFKELSVTKETTHWFDANASDWGFTSMLALKELHEKHYLVTGELTIVVKVSVLEVIGKLDVPEESEENTKALRNIEENDTTESNDLQEENDTTESNDLQEENDTTESNDLHKEASAVKECMDVNGFRVLPSQVESVRRIFERHPEVASKFRPKNAHLRSSSMNVLLSLIETICQSTKELSKDDLADAYSALGYLMASGLNLDWLEEKLKEVSEKKEIEEAGETRIQGMEEELKELKQKCLNLEAQLKKEREDVSVARAPLRFDDVV